MRVINNNNGINHFHITALIILCSAGAAYSIGCFVCSSEAGSDRLCEDSFDNFNSFHYRDSCMASMKGRGGLYPASACLKISGFYENGDNVTIRSCALDGGSLTADTEIVRLSHCGTFYIDERYIRGCIEVCDNVDGCNSSEKMVVRRGNMLCLLIFLLISHFNMN